MYTSWGLFFSYYCKISDTLVFKNCLSKVFKGLPYSNTDITKINDNSGLLICSKFFVILLRFSDFYDFGLRVTKDTNLSRWSTEFLKVIPIWLRIGNASSLWFSAGVSFPKTFLIREARGEFWDSAPNLNVALSSMSLIQLESPYCPGKSFLMSISLRMSLDCRYLPKRKLPAAILCKYKTTFLLFEHRVSYWGCSVSQIA